MDDLFGENILNRIKDENPYIGIQILCEEYLIFFNANLANEPIDIELYNKALNAYSFILALDNKWELNVKTIDITGTRRDNLNKINTFVQQITTQAEQKYTSETIDIASKKYNLLFGNEFYYEINDDDFNKIQKNINELRDLITKSEKIEEKQKERLLIRLESLQKELNKRVSDFDKFFGVVIEISGHIGKVGENIKPFNDRLKEIVDIIVKIMKIPTGQILLEEGTSNNKLEE